VRLKGISAHAEPLSCSFVIVLIVDLVRHRKAVHPWRRAALPSSGAAHRACGCGSGPSWASAPYPMPASSRPHRWHSAATQHTEVCRTNQPFSRALSVATGCQGGVVKGDFLPPAIVRPCTAFALVLLETTVRDRHPHLLHLFGRGGVLVRERIPVQARQGRPECHGAVERVPEVVIQFPRLGLLDQLRGRVMSSRAMDGRGYHVITMALLVHLGSRRSKRLL
jgi:hypothetical protein